MALPEILGTWENFVATWCLGQMPAQNPETVEEALSVLFRLWPERAQEIATGTHRGLMTISPAIDDGLMLHMCERLNGFEKVLRRLRAGERSAYSELILASRLVSAGLEPTLEPPLGSGNLDTRVTMREGDVWFEVIAPETSDAILEMRVSADKLATTLLEQNAGRRIEVLLSVDISEEVTSRVADAIRLHPDSDDTWSLDMVALVSKFVAGDKANVGPTIAQPHGSSAAIIGVAKSSITAGIRTCGIVRVPVTDNRAKRLLYAESHHFSREEMNILVMDLTKVPGKSKGWAPIIERCLQPGQNRRFGAVVLFSTGLALDTMAGLQEWRVVRNPYAYKPVPESLLQQIANADT